MDDYFKIIAEELRTGINQKTGKPLTDLEKAQRWSAVASAIAVVAVGAHYGAKGLTGKGAKPSKNPVLKGSKDGKNYTLDRDKSKGSSGYKKASGAVPKLSTLNEAEQLKLANQYKKKSPINIPENASIKAQSKNGYEQISYKWKENGETIEVRWHTRTPGAPEGQGNTFVVEKNIPGTADGQRRSQQVLVGKDKWVSKNDWQKAITDRKNGVSTPEQDKMLTDGHWKE
ncbi:hypothetical protein ACWOC1_13895 [Enterococcus quebecensis]|uniref:Uncharacterized protein n=1 Tax=Enterococcus quebecensis TaxID=903983 RepID=A0A1E5GSP0_9ENTE|nr:hypothetical protein [Enterococcus quebecensis]OEG15702.1 hypothetical protein BCR23_09565 [Enterococcus quebecensis]